VRQLSLALSGRRIGRLAERDHRLGGQHHEEPDEVALVGRSVRNLG